jgi:Uma2 family endonuclease
MATDLAFDTVTPPHIVTPQQLAAMPNDKDFELVDGHLVERAMGNEAAWITSRLNSRIERHVEACQLGWVFGSEAGYRIDPHRPNLLRKPDISFVRHGRLPGGKPSKSYENLAPDLVVEVVSPNDTVAELEEKIEEYLSAGVQLIWIVNPSTETVRVHRADKSVTVLRESDRLGGEDILPGFDCAVMDIFQITPSSPQNPS